MPSVRIPTEKEKREIDYKTKLPKIVKKSKIHNMFLKPKATKPSDIEWEILFTGCSLNTKSELLSYVT